MADDATEDGNLSNFLAASVETIRDRLDRLQEQMASGFTAVRGDIERVHLRLDTLDRALTARLDQMDTEISRLRSVVYLLAKDRPELLRMLGLAPGA